MDCSYLTGLKREVTSKRYILLRTARTAPPTPVPTRLLSNLDKNSNIVNCNQIVAKGL